MKNVRALLKETERLVSDRSPAILSSVGVAGTVLTAYLSGTATWKAAGVLQGKEELNNQEKIALVWTLYIPAAGTGVITVASIIMANRIGTRRAAAIAAAYSISEKAFAQYRDKVVEKLGEHKERAARDELAQDRVSADPASKKQVIITAANEVLCYEAHTGRYFTSSMETLRRAENSINYKLMHDNYASLSDFYDLVGLPSTSYSEDVGWSSMKLLELTFSAVLSEQDTPCISIDYKTQPIRNFYRQG